MMIIIFVAASSEDQSKQLDLALSEVERFISEQGLSYLFLLSSYITHLGLLFQ